MLLYSWGFFLYIYLLQCTKAQSDCCWKTVFSEDFAEDKMSDCKYIYKSTIGIYNVESCLAGQTKPLTNWKMNDISTVNWIEARNSTSYTRLIHLIGYNSYLGAELTSKATFPVREDYAYLVTFVAFANDGVLGVEFALKTSTGSKLISKRGLIDDKKATDYQDLRFSYFHKKPDQEQVSLYMKSDNGHFWKKNGVAIGYFSVQSCYDQYYIENAGDKHSTSCKICPDGYKCAGGKLTGQCSDQEICTRGKADWCPEGYMCNLGIKGRKCHSSPLENKKCYRGIESGCSDGKNCLDVIEKPCGDYKMCTKGVESNCPNNKYCKNAISYSCPSNADCNSGIISCFPGFLFKEVDSTCTTCTYGSICDQGVATQCPGTKIPNMAGTQCIDCPENGKHCIKGIESNCPNNHYCKNGIPYACRTADIARAGNCESYNAVNSCKGPTSNDSIKCNICNANTYKDGDVCKPCPSNAVCSAGTGTFVCSPGFLRVGATCTTCTPGSICIAGVSATQCGNTTIPNSAKTQCISCPDGDACQSGLNNPCNGLTIPNPTQTACVACTGQNGCISQGDSCLTNAHHATRKCNKCNIGYKVDPLDKFRCIECKNSENGDGVFCTPCQKQSGCETEGDWCTTATSNILRCKKCKWGFTLNTVSGLCTKCDDDKYSNGADGSTCQSCKSQTGCSSTGTRCLVNQNILNCPQCDHALGYSEDSNGVCVKHDACQDYINTNGKGPCNSGVCRNNGSSYLCDCSGTGYKGLNCLDNIDDCAGDPCGTSTAGNCIDKLNTFSCVCHEGFYLFSNTCKKCDLGSYCPGDQTKKSCAQGYDCSNGKSEEPCPANYCVDGVPKAHCPLKYNLCEYGFGIVTCPANFKCISQTTKQQCTSGDYCPPGTTTATNDCPEGSFCPDPTQRVDCQNDGSYCPLRSVQATRCPEGFVCPTSKKKIPCTAGKYCPQGSEIEKDCPKGSKCQLGVPELCPGTSIPDSVTGNATCKPCPLLTMCKKGESIPCLGTKIPNPLQTDCESCPVGFTCAAGEKSQCPKSTICTNGVSTSCPGTKIPNQAQTACEPCPGGNLCVNGTKTQCLPQSQCKPNNSTTVCITGKPLLQCNECIGNYKVNSAGECKQCGSGLFGDGLNCCSPQGVNKCQKDGELCMADGEQSCEICDPTHPLKGEHGKCNAYIDECVANTHNCDINYTQACNDLVGGFQCVECDITGFNVINGILSVKDGTENLYTCKFLNLSHAGITSILPKSFDNFTNLIGIDLTNNDISSLPPGVFDVIDLNGGTLTLDRKTECTSYGFEIIKGVLERKLGSKYTHLDSCTELNLEGAKIMKIDKNSFKGFGHLSSIKLSNNHLVDVSEKKFINFLPSTIKILDLAVNRINVLEPNSFNKLIELNELDLNNNLIANLKVGTFSNMNKFTNKKKQRRNVNNNIKSNLNINLKNNRIDCCSSEEEILLLMSNIHNIEMECFGANKTVPVLLSPTIWKSEYEKKCNSLNKIHHEDKKNNLALILGVVGGVLIAVLIGIIIIVYVYKRKKEVKDLLNGQSAAEFVHDAKAYDDNVHNPSTNYNNLDVDELDGSSLVGYRNIDALNPDFEYAYVDSTKNSEYATCKVDDRELNDYANV